ncbi:8860_t:CDS:2 [Funneliformis caledonium]|uniref:8860_t:CDS:1 n=1 Tax=Funneliformis caledonium TaxID=1117310 RepID=A0A9N9CU21_9GLOM|nr:8860_t:CDS:2 [Funneliformis caledonium]
MYNQEEKEEIFSLAIQKKVLNKRPTNNPSSSEAASESTSIN